MPVVTYPTPRRLEENVISAALLGFDSQVILSSHISQTRPMVSKLGVYSKEEVRDIVRAKWEELTAASSNADSAAASPVSDAPPLDRSSRTRRLGALDV